MSTAPQLIALYSPQPRSGKSEVARRLIEEHGYTPLKFAEPLKYMLWALLSQCTPSGMGRIDDWLEGGLKDETHPVLGHSPRYLMQTLGTEWGRDTVGAEMWTSIWKRKAQTALEAGCKVVCDDLRFNNELDCITELGGEAWTIIRPDVAVSYDHRSEGALAGANLPIILNGDSLEALWHQADIIAGGPQQ